MSADTLPIINRTYQQSMDALNQLMNQNPNPSIRQLMELIEKTSVIPPNVNVNTVFLLYSGTEDISDPNAKGLYESVNEMTSNSTKTNVVKLGNTDASRFIQDKEFVTELKAAIARENNISGSKKIDTA